jgi:hypothetical protein
LRTETTDPIVLRSQCALAKRNRRATHPNASGNGEDDASAC